MTEFSQHISFFHFSLEEKASRCKHETMHELSESHLSRAHISRLGLVILLYFTFHIYFIYFLFFIFFYIFYFFIFYILFYIFLYFILFLSNCGGG